MKILQRIFGGTGGDIKKDELGRNDVCWCGSGKKYKRCHLEKDADKERIRNAMKPKKK